MRNRTTMSMSSIVTPWSIFYAVSMRQYRCVASLRPEIDWSHPARPGIA
jgi:hypothetical protein